MITQSLHFEITGQDAQRFLSVCQERNIEPVVAFESFLKDFTKSYQNKADDELRAKNWLMQGHCRIWQIPNLWH
ncbi:MAG: hypothetical protein Q4B88_00625 [Moraxella sp.]|nr:hypothetical protein [Moraxella sp.]